jgi:hypothetical protein|tara:strand:- start:230 stop:604 length:375 start_codon:yes stop_codon:yes gene_type:complete
MDMRLLGLAYRRNKLTRHLNQLLSLTWLGFAAALITGSLLFITKAPDYILNLQFQLKMIALLLAGLNMLVFHLGVYRHVDHWDTELPTPIAARIAGGLSIIFWTAVIVFGNWVGFTLDYFIFEI